MKEIRTIQANLDRHMIAFGFRHENGDKDVLNLDLRQLPETTRIAVRNLVRTALPDAVRDAYVLTLPDAEAPRVQTETLVGSDQQAILDLVEERIGQILQFSNAGTEVKMLLTEILEIIDGAAEDPLDKVLG